MEKMQKAIAMLLFHNAQINHFNFLGEDGQEAMLGRESMTQEKYKALPWRIKYAAKLFVDRAFLAYEYRRELFSDEEWKLVEEDIKATFNLPLMKITWEKFGGWHKKEFRDYIDGLVDQK